MKYRGIRSRPFFLSSPALSLREACKEVGRDESGLRHHGLRARDVMTHDVVAVNEDTPIALIADLLERHQIKRVPVLRAGKMIGIVEMSGSLCRAITRGDGDG